MDSVTQQIKDKLDLVDFIRGYITLLPAGKNFKGVCPFHKEKTPSFMVSPDRQTWHCFGACNEGGDIFKFLMKYENLEFYEALKILAEKAGIELRRVSPADQKQFGILYDLNNLAKEFFKKNLAVSKETTDYVKARGLKKETAEEFELGLAPSGYDALNVHLLKLGFDVKDIERAGLVFKSDKGRYFDRFHDRLMFPIHNSFGKVVGFTGRIFPTTDNRQPAANMGKYVNSPETPIFNKSKILYGFHKTKDAIRETKLAVLVEGQMDFLMMHQDGIKNVAATSGTALTPDHLRTLRRFTDELIFSFDNDEAGMKAAERSIDLANALDFNVKILELKEFKDPADAASQKPGIINELITKAVPAMEFYFTRYLGRDMRNETAGIREVSEIKRNIRSVLLKIKNLPSPVEQRHWIKELGEIIRMDEKVLIEEMEKMKTAVSENAVAARALADGSGIVHAPNYSITSRRELIAERLLALLAVKDGFKDEIENSIKYLPPQYREIFGGMTEKDSIRGEELKNAINTISLRGQFEFEILGEERMEEELKNLIREIKMEYLKEERERILGALKAVEKRGNETETKELLAKFDEISKIMHNAD